MAKPTAPEKKIEVLAAIKEKGMSITEAAAAFGIAQTSIRKWIRGKVDNRHSTPLELLRLRRENVLLKEIVASFVLEKEVAKRYDRAR